MPLTDTKVRSTKPGAKPIKLSDGGGLQLTIQPGGTRSWSLAYRFDGKQKRLAFGTYPKVTLAQARTLTAKAKEHLAAGRDPSAPPDAAPPEKPCITLAEAGDLWLAAKRPGWDESHFSRVESRLRKNVYPPLGATRLDRIGPADVLAAVRVVEARGAVDMGRRTRQAIESIYRFAISSSWVERNPATGLQDALAARPKVKHRTKLAEADVKEFLARVRGYDGDEITRLAIEFILRSAVRTSELRFAVCSEFQGDLWRIPGSRMKIEGGDHLVPITSQMRRILDRAKAIGRESEYVFPGKGGKPMSQNTMIYAAYRMGYHSKLTIHGLRGTFSTAANESGLFHPDAIERQLAHYPRDEVRAAYNAAEHLPQRVQLMTWWNDRLDSLVGLSSTAEP